MSWTGFTPDKWAKKAEAVQTAILRNSVQELANAASTTIPNGGPVPIDTGNLARSVVIDNKPPEQIDTLAESPNFSLGLANIKPGDDVYIGWQANYAHRVNYGFVGEDILGRYYNQSGYGFAEATAAKWPEIVLRQAQKASGNG